MSLSWLKLIGKQEQTGTTAIRNTVIIAIKSNFPTKQLDVRRFTRACNRDNRQSLEPD